MSTLCRKDDQYTARAGLLSLFPRLYSVVAVFSTFFSLSHDKTSEILLPQQKLAACSVVSEGSVIMSNWDSDVGNKEGDTRKALH